MQVRLRGRIDGRDGDGSSCISSGSGGGGGGGVRGGHGKDVRADGAGDGRRRIDVDGEVNAAEIDGAKRKIGEVCGVEVGEGAAPKDGPSA